MPAASWRTPGRTRPWPRSSDLMMSSSSPIRVEPVSVPTLTVLPPSSDTESWSPSPRPPGRSHRSRTRTKRRCEGPAGLHGSATRPGWGETPQIVVENGERHRSPSPSAERRSEDSPSHDLLLPPPRSWSRSPSPSRRSRWSLRSLLSRDSDVDGCRLVSSQSAPDRTGLQFSFSSFTFRSRELVPDYRASVIRSGTFLSEFQNRLDL